MVKDPTMKCWHCGAEQEKPASGGRLSFRALCCRCDAWLHCCKNCQNYKPGLPNDCMVPGTDPIADREAFNFCEEFSLKGTLPTKNDMTVFIFGPSLSKCLKSLSTIFETKVCFNKNVWNFFPYSVFSQEFCVINTM